MIDITPAQAEAIRGILRKHLPDAEIRAFGSRVTGKSKPYSDLDLAVVGKTTIDSRILIKLTEELQESDIPFRVDIVDWNSISPEFKAIIGKKFEIFLPV